MANAIYPAALKAFLDADIDLTTSNIKIALLDNTYTHSAAHEFLDDISGGSIVATSGNLASKTTTAGTFDAADVTFTTVSGDDIDAWVVYVDTGTASTSRLVAYVDTNADTTPVHIEPDGSDITLQFNASGILTI